VSRLAKARGIGCGIGYRFALARGKGSHGTLYFGGARAVVPDLKRELKTGTLHAILKQLGLTLDDLR
jgi:mRNA interferase HicA